MKSNVLNNIHSDSSGYNQIARIYHENKEKLFEEIPVKLYEWFDANMAAPFGAVLDLLVLNCINKRLYYDSSDLFRKYRGSNVAESYFGHLYRQRTTGVGTFGYPSYH